MKRIMNLFLRVSLSVVFALLLSRVDAKTYYISNSGKDEYIGTNFNFPWSTIAKVNSIVILPGDSVLFEAGGIWRERLVFTQGALGDGNRVYYGRYGIGANPIILGSNSATLWTESGVSNVWRSGTSMPVNPRNGPSGRPSEIFFIRNNVTSWGDFQTYDESFTNLKKEYDWTWYNGTIYVYAVSDPDSRYDLIEVPQREYCIYGNNSASSYMEFNGIDMLYAMMRGFGTSYPEAANQTDLTFKNLTIAFIGEINGASSFGIAAFHSNFLVDSCHFSDIGRRAISINFYESSSLAGGTVDLRDVVIRNSTFRNGFHTTSLDLAMMSLPRCEGYSVRNVYFYNNLIDDSKTKIIANLCNQIFVQEGGGYISDVYIFNNIFIHSPGRNMNIEDGDAVYIWNNTIVGHNSKIIASPYSNITINRTQSIDFRNNILYDNLPDNNLHSHGILVYYTPTIFTNKDYNLYYSSNPGIERHFCAHRANNDLSVGVRYWNTNQWADYLVDNPLFEQHSPAPEDPDFVDYEELDFRLNEGSPARGAGVAIDLIKTDFCGNAMNNPPDLGAIQFGSSPPPIPPVNPPTPSFETNELSLTLAPNPVLRGGEVKIGIVGKLPSSSFFIRLIDQSGQCVFKSQDFYGSMANISVPLKIGRGIYIVKIIFNDSSIVTGKLSII